jgi:tRNA/rRNA methyltransferase
LIPYADNLRVVLVATRNPLNLGAAARAMSNFGFLRLRVVNPYEVAFREARSAVGASDVLLEAQEFGSVADAVGDCSLVVGTTAVRTRELHHAVRRLEEGAQLIREHLARGKVAVLFGSEKVGLSNSELNHCHCLMRIPTREEHISMNLGQAVAVSLYEVARGAVVNPHLPTAGRYGEPSLEQGTGAGVVEPASAADAERMTSVLFDALRLSGYVEERAAAITEEKVRRLVRRMDMSARDVEVWLGMLRQIVWKLKG